MRSKIKFQAFLLLLLASFSGSSYADNSGLVGMLTSQLGVSEAQASGGAGAIFDYAKGKLSTDDFSSVASALPSIGALIASKPEVKKKKSGLGGMLSSLSSENVGGTLGMVSALSGSFSALGLDAEMITKYVPVILQYAESKGGKQVMDMLKGVLES